MHTDDIKRHAEEAYPRECCGVITETKTIRCTNASNQPYKNWFIDWRELSRIVERGHLIRGYYHSHVDAPAIPSKNDLLNIHAPSGTKYVIVSVIRGEAKDLRYYTLTGSGEHKQFDKV